jgi:hypothetical protein
MPFYIHKKLTDSHSQPIRDAHDQVLEFDTYHEAHDHVLKSKLTHEWAKGRITIEQARDQESA